MFKRFRDKVAFSGITVLMIGVALLIFTFISAYGFLTQNLSIMATEDLVTTFGGALAPLIATCIRIMYLGVMGWIGSLVTIRGVTIIAHAPQNNLTVASQRPTERPRPSKKLDDEKQQDKPEKPESRPAEPEIVVITPEVSSPIQQGQDEK
jgi:hypothetical protein